MDAASDSSSDASEQSEPEIEVEKSVNEDDSMSDIEGLPTPGLHAQYDGCSERAHTEGLQDALGGEDEMREMVDSEGRGKEANGDELTACDLIATNSEDVETSPSVDTGNVSVELNQSRMLF